MRRSPLSTHTAWCCSVLWIIIVLGQSKFADSKPTDQSVNYEICYNISKTLVNVVTDALRQLQNSSSKSFNCSYTSVALQFDTPSEKNTLGACLPQTCICSNISKLVTDKDQCLMAIHSDIKSFRSKLQDASTTLTFLNKVIGEMMGAIKRYDDGKDEEKRNCKPIDCEIRQCSAILKFQRRAVTIARVFSYLKEEAVQNYSH